MGSELSEAAAAAAVIHEDSFSFLCLQRRSVFSLLLLQVLTASREGEIVLSCGGVMVGGRDNVCSSRFGAAGNRTEFGWDDHL